MRLNRQPCVTCEADTLHNGITCTHCGTIVQMKTHIKDIRRKVFLKQFAKSGNGYVAAAFFAWQKHIAEGDARHAFEASREIKARTISQKKQGTFGRGRDRTRC